MNPNVKMCILMDCTASMEAWIQAAKDQIETIVRNISHANFQVAFIGYRDYGDETPLITIPFTTSSHMLAQIRDIHAEGGDDFAEDVEGGMRAVENLDWSGADVKTVIHIADAPPHGIGFHAPHVSDRFPDTPRQGLLGLVRDLSTRGVDYTFLRISSDTDLMLELFHNAYVGSGVFKVLDLHSQGEQPLGLTSTPPRIRHRARPAASYTDLLTPTITRSLEMSIDRYSASQDPLSP